MSQARFNLKSHRQDPALIVLVYRVRGERLVYSTGMHTALKYWDVARGRVKSVHLYSSDEKLSTARWIMFGLADLIFPQNVFDCISTSETPFGE